MGDKPRSRLASSDRRERVLRFVRHYFAGTPAEPSRMPPSIFISVPVKYPDSSEASIPATQATSSGKPKRLSRCILNKSRHISLTLWPITPHRFPHRCQNCGRVNRVTPYIQILLRAVQGYTFSMIPHACFARSIGCGSWDTDDARTR